MTRTAEQFLDIILRTQCCVADMAYKALKQEMFLKPDRIIAFNNVRYIQVLLRILNRYYDTVYLLQDDGCLTEDEIEDIIQETKELCDHCGCCTDAAAIRKDI